MRDHVWLVWPSDDIDDGTPDAKLPGVFPSEDLARDRIKRSAQILDFRDHPEAFEISRYGIDRDGSTEGYVGVSD